MPERLPGHRGAACGDKEIVTLTLPQQLDTRPFHVSTHLVDGSFAQGHQPFLAALAEDADNPHVKVDFVQFQAHQLGNAQTGGVEGFQHGAVTLTQRGVVSGRGKQGFDLLFGHPLGQARRFGRHGDFQRRVAPDPPARQQVAKKTAEGREVAHLRRGAHRQRKLRDKAGQFGFADRQQTSGRLFLEPARQVQQVAAVAGEGGFR